MTGLWVALGVLALASAFGLWFQRNNGRVKETGRPTTGVPMVADGDLPAVIEAEPLDADSAALAPVLIGRLGERATIVQFSSAFCQPCRATRRILEEVAVLVPGVSHVEIDAEENLELVRALDIRRTPTVLFLDRHGLVRKQASGQPRKADIVAALGELLPEEGPDFSI